MDRRSRGNERPPLPSGDPPGWRRKAEPPLSRERTARGDHRQDKKRERSRGRSAREPSVEDRNSRRSRNPEKGSAASGDTAGRDLARAGSSLGRTSGVAAAGAWAARWEIASLLEAGCNPADLVEDIKGGREGEHILNVGVPSSLVGSLQSWSLARSPEKSKPGRSVTEKADSVKEKLWDTDSEWDEDLSKQQAILDSLAGPRHSSAPPWISGAASSASKVPGATTVGPGYLGMSSGSQEFRKAAMPPPLELRVKGPVKSKDEAYKKEEGANSSSDLGSFAKKAKPPPRREPSDERDRSRGRDRSRRRRRSHRESGPISMAQKESSEMEKYFEDSLTIFELLLKKYEVEMELAEIIAPSGKVDLERFRLFTRPKRASTGLNYTRLMQRFMAWRRDRSDLDKRTNGLDAKLGILEFTESLIQEQVGYLTPRSFLYAVDYFATAFGFNATGGYWNRAKRLAGSYASSKVEPTSRAPLFQKATLAALETAVLDPFMSRPERIACGKLRLCVQSSTRFDDLLNTPLNRCEWVRRPGETTIIGLRSRALRGKTGARQWIAALSGVEAGNDKWLPTLMELVLSSHGATWRDDDHFGKMASSDMVNFLRRPACISTDVSLIKSALEKYRREGLQIGLDPKELQILRWHGAKATLSSVMQHLGIREKAVRFQGGWASRAETMPDTYLREAQTLVLTVQQRCLDYLRSGGEVTRLEGLPVDQGSGAGEPAATTGKTPKDEVDAALVAKAMETSAPLSRPPEEVTMAFLDDEFDDDLKLGEEVLAKEASVRQEGDNWDECLVDPDEAADEESIRSPTPMKDDPVPPPDREISPEEDMDERDSEGFITHWVQAKDPNVKHRVHLPAEETMQGGLAVVVKPKCGISGTFELAKAEDPLDSSTLLCRRCLPRTSESKCEGICTRMHLGRKNLVVQRCFRRCCLGETSHEDHKCTLHVDMPEREGHE